MLSAPLAVVTGARSNDVFVDFLGPPSLVSGFGLRGGGGGEGGERLLVNV